LKRTAPWILWVVAAAVCVPLAWTSSGLGVAPAVVEVRQVVLSSPAAARLMEVLVAPGDAVVEGQVLARLDPAEVDMELAIASAELKRLELEVSSREVELHDERYETSSRLAAEAERAALEVTRLVAEGEQDRSELTQLDEQLAREQGLVNEGLARSENLNALKLKRAALARKVEEFKSAVAQARANAASTTQRLGQWRQGAATKSTPGSHIGPQLAPGAAAVEAQGERVRQLELLRARLELKAPFTGRVDAVLLRAGAAAAQGAPVVSVVDDRPGTAIAYVDQRWAGRVRVGDVASLAPSDRSGPPLPGRVVALGAAISELPVRFRHIPSEPAFGRDVFIRLDVPAPLPGQAFNATFRHGATAMGGAGGTGGEGGTP
jgi:multidrug resistance efflux pump